MQNDFSVYVIEFILFTLTPSLLGAYEVILINNFISAQQSLHLVFQCWHCTLEQFDTALQIFVFR